MKKTWKFLVLLVMLTMFTAACSNGEESGSGSDDKVTLTAWAWNVNVGALEAAMEQYKKDHPNVELKVEDIGRLDVYDKLSTGLAAGGVGLPDIVLVEDDRIGGYVNAFPKGFLNLSEEGFDENENLFPQFKNDLAKVDGTYYAMPFDAGPTGVFYRRDLFEQAGVNPDDIETWDQYLEAGKKILDTTGAQMLPIDKFKDDATFRMMLNQQGVYYYDAEGNIDLTHPSAVQAMEMQKKLDDAGLVKNINGWNGVVSATIDGSVATIPFGAWYYGTIIDQAADSKGNWGVFQLPAFEEGGNRAANLGGSSWMIPSATENKEEAYSFVEYFTTNVDAQLVAMEEYGLFPSLTSVYETDSFTAEVEFFGGQPIWKLFGDEMPDVPSINYTEDYSIGLDESIKAQADVFNGKDSKTALQEAADRLKDRTEREVNSH